MIKRIAVFLVLGVLIMAAAAPVYRLRNFEKAPDTGYTIQSGVDGVAEWVQGNANGAITVNNTPINYTPNPITNPIDNRNQVVIAPNGDKYIIDEGGASTLIKEFNPDPEANDIFYDDSDSGIGDDVATALDSLARRVSGGGSGTTSYTLSGGAVFSGDAGDGSITLQVVSAGNVVVTIPAGIYSFDLNIPSGLAGVDAGNQLTVTFNFPSGVAFNQGENSMRYPSAHLYSRATEASNGFDVELRGNNPQSRLLPFATAGRCAHQFAGVNAAGSTWMAQYRF